MITTFSLLTLNEAELKARNSLHVIPKKSGYKIWANVKIGLKVRVRVGVKVRVKDRFKIEISVKFRMKFASKLICVEKILCFRQTL